MTRTAVTFIFFSALIFVSALPGQSFNVTVNGGDAIFLAGRTDVRIPPASEPWNGPKTHLVRHNASTPEEIMEMLPPMIPVKEGDIVRALDPAVGGINFFLGFGPPFFGPSGNGLAGSNLQALDGISGYLGPEGPLAGVFLTDEIPDSGPAPERLDFRQSGIGIDFELLSPQIGQVFYIGDGVTSDGAFQQFVAPANATRLLIGIPDGFGFDGPPGAYDDNDGSYQIFLGINQIPDLIGDINCDGVIDLLDIAPFVTLIISGQYSIKADINQDSSVDLLDIAPFIVLLSG